MCVCSYFFLFNTNDKCILCFYMYICARIAQIQVNVFAIIHYLTLISLIWLWTYLPDEGHSRNAACAMNLISMFFSMLLVFNLFFFFAVKFWQNNLCSLALLLILIYCLQNFFLLVLSFFWPKWKWMIMLIDSFFKWYK